MFYFSSREHHVSTTEAIQHEIRDGVAEVVMSRPPVNALDVASWFKLAEVLRALGANSAVRAVVLRAEGKGFNAGVDIKEMQQAQASGAGKFDALLGANRGCFA